MRSIGLPELLVVFGFALLILGPLWVIPYWKIFSKAGFPGPLSVLMLVPVLGLVVLYMIAFSDWPILQRQRPPQ